MNKSGRLTLVKSTLSAIPIYLTMSDKLPPWVIKELDRIRRNFLWNGTDSAVRGKNAVAWPTVCHPTAFGGLGILDFKLAGYALRTRWLWLQRTDGERTWAELQINVEPEVRAFFNASILISVGNGNRSFFWSDSWIEGQSVAHLAPNLLATIPTRTVRRRTVAQAIPGRNWIGDIRGGLSVQAMVEYIDLWQRLAGFSLAAREDTFRWRWTADGNYSAS